MNRVHLFEWGDKPWLPSVFRDFITDHLHYVMTWGEIYRPILRVLHDTLQLSGESRIVDLCSGGGGPFPWLAQKLQEEYRMPVQVTLTDLYPREDAIDPALETDDGQIVYRRESTNALDVPDDLKGVRTLFTGLHHFRPPQVTSMLQDAISKRQTIAAFEPQRRDSRSMFHVAVYNLVSSFFLTPQIGNLSASRLLFTYVLPIAPFCYLWDGLVSCLRTYSTDELRSITARLPPNDYEWVIQEIDSPTLLGTHTLTYLIGMPRRSVVPSHVAKVSAAQVAYESADRSWQLAHERLQTASNEFEKAAALRDTKMAELRNAIQELNERAEDERHGSCDIADQEALEKRRAKLMSLADEVTSVAQGRQRN